MDVEYAQSFVYGFYVCAEPDTKAKGKKQKAVKSSAPAAKTKQTEETPKQQSTAEAKKKEAKPSPVLEAPKAREMSEADKQKLAELR